MPELYNLDADIAEAENLAEQRPEVFAEMRTKLDEVISRGASRPGATSRNDTAVRYDATQEVRWAPASE